MRYKVELLNWSGAGEKKELFHVVVYAQSGNEAIIKAQKKYAVRHPVFPLPPPEVILSENADLFSLAQKGFRRRRRSAHFYEGWR